VAVTVGIKIFHIPFIQERLVKLFRRAQASFDYHAIGQAAHLGLHERPQISRRNVHRLDAYIQFAIQSYSHTRPHIIRLHAKSPVQKHAATNNACVTSSTIHPFTMPFNRRPNLILFFGLSYNSIYRIAAAF
jgi:hypothetical protein